MLALLVLFQMQLSSFSCEEVQPYINMVVLKKLKYDGEGIPDITYCPGKMK